MNILIVGDSFSANWSVKYSDANGWPNLLANKFTVTNLSQAGCSEYKIYQQLTSVDINKFDFVIVSHTSPYRIVTKNHPVHSNDPLHKNADLIFSDIEFHKNKFINTFNKSLTTAYNIFQYHRDDEFQETIYYLLREKINQIISNKPSLVINHLLVPEKFVTEKQILTISDITPNNVNHLSIEENFKVYQTIVEKIYETNH